MATPTSKARIRSWIAAILLAQAAAAQAGPDTVQVLCSVHEWCPLVRDAFERATGAKVVITEKGSAEALDLIVAERARPRHDVWYGGTGDFHLQAAGLHLTLPYRSPNNALLHGWAVRPAEQAGYRTVGIYSGPLGLLLNRAVLAKHRIPEPRCWSDLVNPSLRGLIAMSDPRYSGTAYTLIATLVQIMGEEEAFAYLAKLDANVAHYAHSGARVLADVEQGSAGIAIAFVHESAEQGEPAAHLKALTPCEGTGYEIGSMSIIKGGPNTAAAKRFFDWALTAEAQDLAVRTRQFKLSSNRNGRFDPRIVDPAETRLINYDFATYARPDVRDRLVARWLKQVGNPSKF